MNETAQTLILEALAQRWKNYRAQRKACRQEFSEEAVHDLRVAARRMLALIEALRGALPHPRLKKLRRDLKLQLDSFDALRDTQVMLADISEHIAQLPELSALQQFLQKREKRLLHSAQKQIEGFQTDAIARRIHKTRQMLQNNPSDALSARLLGAVDDAYQTVIQRYGLVDPSQPASIHRMRVAFKKFRYMVEVIHPLLPGFPTNLLKRLHDYQTAMGDIQDVEVFLQTHAHFAARHADYDPHPVRLFYERRHAELIFAFVASMHALHTFWRAAPEQPFPWETHT